MAELLYGFHQLADVADNRLGPNNIPLVNTAVNQAVEEYNRQLDSMIALFVSKTTDPKLSYSQYGNYRSQPLDQNGRARPIKRAGKYDIAFPILGSGNAWGANYVTRALMTIQEANDATQALLSGDTTWMSDHILAGLFANAPWTFNDEKYGALTIEGLANGDATVYGVFSGSASAATDNHYLFQAADIADATNPFPTIFRELNEHPENSGQIIALVATDLRDDIENLATFRERADANVRVGANSDELVGNLSAPVPGTLIGYCAGVWIVEWPSLPSGYMITTTADGQQPLAMREYNVATLQGFKKVADRDDHPFYESQYARWAGFGGWNRVGALVYQVGAGAYSVPTGFGSPMP